jgi:anti-sigma factor RsiW
MECHNARRLAEAHLSRQLPAETDQQVLQHLAECGACRAEFDARRRMKLALREAFGRASDLEPRPEFLAALPARLREKSPRSQRTRAWLLVAAAAVLLLAALARPATHWFGAARFAALARDAAADHRDCAVQFRLAERPISLEQAAQRFVPAYRSLVSVQPSPATLARGPLKVLDRHSCVLGNRRFAHIVLEYHGSLVSVLIAPDSVARVPAGIQEIDGARVSAFRAAQFVGLVVSSVDEDETRQIAAAMTTPVVRALAGA